MTDSRRDRSAGPELTAAIEARVAALSLEEKISLLTAPDFSSLRPLSRVGLGEIVVSDGPSGVRGRHWDERDPSQNIPCSAALGATWDEDIVERMGAIMGHDARDKGIDVVLAPCVNIQRTPYAGRHFEYFSEDPVLSGRLGAAYVRGLQKLGVGATVKHFVANDSETERMTADVIVDERTLREIYMAPFEIIVQEACPWLIMSSYNVVNGQSMSESSMLRDVLKTEWGFDGYVMSDFLATPPTVAAAAGGLDIAMPWPKGRPTHWEEMLAEAVRQGGLDEAALDDKVERLLLLAYRCGVLDGYPGKAPVTERSRPEETADLRVAAASAFVLTKNDGAVLPFVKGELSSIAVIGPNAREGRANGGGSAKVYPAHVVSPLEGVTRAVGDEVEVRFAEGARPYHWQPVARAPWLQQPDRDEDGVKVEFLDEGQAVLASETRNAGEFAWTVHYADGVEFTSVAWVRVSGRIVAQETGRHSVGLSGVGDYRLSLGKRAAFDIQHRLGPEADITQGFTFPPQSMYDIDLAEGEVVDFEILHKVGTFRPKSPLAMFQIRLATPFGDEDEELERAVEIAESSDVAVVIVGNDADVDAEGADRPDLVLRGRQDELVRRVVAANPQTVVVVNTASPTVLTWADEVPVILLAWLPGQELGSALAEVLFGEREPGGRLPVSWPRTEVGLPSVMPVDGRLCYEEGIRVGYRAGEDGYRDTQWSFGHGLGFTSWDYLGMDLVGPWGADEGCGTVTVRLRNVGERAGREIVQVYLSKPDSVVDRPEKWLAGFATATAASGEETAVTVRVPASSVRYWTAEGWQVEQGAYVVHASHSSQDVRLTGRIDLCSQVRRKEGP